MAEQQQQSGIRLVRQKQTATPPQLHKCKRMCACTEQAAYASSEDVESGALPWQLPAVPRFARKRNCRSCLHIASSTMQKRSGETAVLGRPNWGWQSVWTADFCSCNCKQQLGSSSNPETCRWQCVPALTRTRDMLVSSILQRQCCWRWGLGA